MLRRAARCGPRRRRGPQHIELSNPEKHNKWWFQKPETEFSDILPGAQYTDMIHRIIEPENHKIQINQIQKSGFRDVLPTMQLSLQKFLLILQEKRDYLDFQLQIVYSIAAGL